MTWRMIAFAAVVSGILMSFLYGRKKPPVIICPGGREFTPQEVAAETRKLAELLEATQKVVDSLNQVGEFREISSIEASIEDNFLFGAFPPVEAAAAKYQANVAQENPARILLPQNLLDQDQRAASRASLARLRSYLAAYQLSLPSDSQRPIFICGNDRAAVADAMSRTFHRSQIELERARFDEIGALLDMMDGIWEAVPSGDTIVFPTLRQREDYHRSISRIQKLAALRTTRDRLLEQRLQKKLQYESIKAPPGIWNFLHKSGVSVSLDRDDITINGKSMVLPVEKAALIAAIGKPREIEGDPARSVWDHWGIMALQETGSTQISSLIIALRPKPTQSWPENMIRGRLTLLGTPVDENSTPWSLNRKFERQRFVSDDSGYEWTLPLRGYTVETQFNWDGTIDSLTIRALPSRP